MFGLLRTVLALMVMAQHITPLNGPLGGYAVFAFFALSGYLMTLVMHESYGYDTRGRLLFVVNRALRIFPPYWFAAILSLGLILLFGQGVVKSHHLDVYYPDSIQSVLQNIFMFYPGWLISEVRPRIVPITWAITVELFFYALICFGISKTMRRTLLWLGASALYVPLTFLLDMDPLARYYTFAAGSLPFSIGALIFFMNGRTGRFLTYSEKNTPALFWLAMVGILGWPIIANALGFPMWPGRYINLTICAWLILGISQGGVPFSISPRTDSAIGDYSYPIYLLHLPCWLFFSISLGESWPIVPVVITTMALSFVLVRYVDAPIQRIRARVKSGVCALPNNNSADDRRAYIAPLRPG